MGLDYWLGKALEALARRGTLLPRVEQLGAGLRRDDGMNEP